jgi:hypothetical protein
MAANKFQPKQALTQSANPVIGYDYVDVAEGAGYVQYYLYQTEDDSAVDYHLTNNSGIYSKEYYTQSAVTTPVSKVLDLDFDIEFNLPQDVEGTAISQYFIYGGATVGNISVYIVTKIIHYDGTTETQIGTATSNTETWGASARKLFVTPINISARKHFSKGDILRVTVEVWADESEGGSETNVQLLHDPMDRTAAVDDLPTNSNILIPFKIKN